MWKYLGLSQGLLEGTGVVEPGQGGSQTQGHCCHLGPLGGYQGHVPQDQQGQVFQVGDSHMGKQQGLSQGLLKGSRVVEPGQDRSQTQGHCHWGHLGGQQGQIRHPRVPHRNHSQGHCHWGPLGGHQSQVLQGQQGQVCQEGDSHMGEQQGLSQGLLKGSKVVEPGQDGSQTQGHCRHLGPLGGYQDHEPQGQQGQTQGHSHWGQGHCHWGPLGGYQSQVHQGQQGQVFQEGGSHMGKQQGLSQGLLKGSKVVEPCQGRSQVQGHCHWGHLEGHCYWGQLGGYQGQVLQVQQGQVLQDGG